MERSEEIEKSLKKKYRSSIWCRFTSGINEYGLVKEGNKIAMCISGGKDSMLMAKLFQELKKHNKNESEASKRQEKKTLLKKFRQTSPYIESNIFKSVENINLNTIISYKQDGIKHHFLDDYLNI